MRHAACLLLFVLLIDAPVRAGIAEYSERGKIDFDTAIELLNPYGTWSKIDGLWAFTPLDHQTPYTNGRWLYTEYGWYWQGNRPYSWATEHYGYWKRGHDHVWSWYPGDTWLPQIVEIRATDTHIGWRSAEVDETGNFVEEPADRYAKSDEWSFVTKAQFAGPITPAMIASPAEAEKLLDDSSDSMHAYLTYRAITRPGPHPADFVALSHGDGMFAPSLAEGGDATAPAAPAPPAKNAPPPITPASGKANAPGGAATNADSGPLDDNGAPADPRQVHYWITMSLPSYWTPRPDSAEPTEVYMYRPDLYQDEDGIQRRITLWNNPKARTSLGDLRNVLSGPSEAKVPATPTPVGKGAPAVPVEGGSTSHDPFQSPFDKSFHGNTTETSPNMSSKAAPSGLNSSTNAAPDGRP